MQDLKQTIGTPTILVLILLGLVVALSFVILPEITFEEISFEAADNALLVTEANMDRWDRLSQLDIFQNSEYDGARIIAPSSAGSYTFLVRNQAGFPFDYTVDISDGNLAKVPMLYRIKDAEGKYLCGSDTLWVPISELVTLSGSLGTGDQTQYTLEWIWPGDDDQVDTAAGIFAQAPTEYILNFLVDARKSGTTMDSGIPYPRIVMAIITFFTVTCITLTPILLAWIYTKHRKEVAEYEK